MATVTVLYPRTESSTFNLDYYKSTHMPMVKKGWTSLGLKSYTVTKFNDDAPYSYAAAMEWDSLESFGKAAADAGTKEIMDDIANFSNEKPIIISGPIVDRG